MRAWADYMSSRVLVVSALRAESATHFRTPTRRTERPLARLAASPEISARESLEAIDARIDGLLKAATLGVEAFCESVWKRCIEIPEFPGIAHAVAAVANEYCLFGLEQRTIAADVAARISELEFTGALRRVVLSGRGGLAGEKTEKAAESWVTSPAPAPMEEVKWVLDFVVETPDGHHVFTDHPFRVYNSAGNKVASGRTDDQGRAQVSVSKQADYRIALGPEDTYRVAGHVRRQVGLEAVADASLELQTADGATIHIQSDGNGEFDATDVPYGTVTIRCDEVEIVRFVDRDLTDCDLYVAPDDEDDEDDDAGVSWHDLFIPEQDVA